MLYCYTTNEGASRLDFRKSVYMTYTVHVYVAEDNGPHKECEKLAFVSRVMMFHLCFIKDYKTVYDSQLLGTDIQFQLTQISMYHFIFLV